MVVVRSRGAERAKAFATALSQRWQMDPNIDKALYRIDVDTLKHKVLLYLSPEDLIALRQKLQQHQDLLKELSQTMVDASICGLGQAAPNPALSVMKYFPTEIE